MQRDMEHLQHELHARLSAFKRKVERTRIIIQEALRQDTVWYVAFSGGIDSTVLLHLVQESGADLDLLWGDDGWDYPETLAFLSSFPVQRIRCLEPWYGWCVEMGRPDLASPGPSTNAAWYNPHAWTDTWQSLKEAREKGYSGVFLGLLATESRGRRYALKNGAEPLYQVASEDGMWHCSPLATWTKRDVWAYAISRAIPYNAAYDRLAALDVPLDHRRVAPLTCFRVMQYGSHVLLRAGWPALFNQLAEHFPAVREFA